MNIAKAYLALHAIMWLPYGIACLLKPEMLNELTGIAMTSATAITEIRAMYGGIQSAVGALCVMALLRASMLRPALATLAFLLTGLAISRSIGLSLDTSGSEYTYGAVGFEAVTAIISWILFLRQPQTV